MKVISLLMCHKLIFVVNMPDKIVTLNDILVSVFCKSGKNYDILFCAQKNKNKNVIELNRKLSFLGKNNKQLEQYYTYCFYA